MALGASGEATARNCAAAIVGNWFLECAEELRHLRLEAPAPSMATLLDTRRVYGLAARAELHSAHPGFTRVG